MRKVNGKWKEIEISDYLGTICPSNYRGGSNLVVISILLLILVVEKIMGKSNSEIIESFVCHLLMQLFGSVETRKFNYLISYVLSSNKQSLRGVLFNFFHYLFLIYHYLVVDKFYWIRKLIKILKIYYVIC